MVRTHSLLGFLRAGILMFPLLPLSITSFAQTEVSYKRGATQLEDILPPSPEAASASSSYHGSGSAFHGRTYEESSRDKVLETTLPEYSEHPEKFSDDVVSGFPILLWKHGTVTEKGVYSIGQLVAESTQKV